jgi:hypothetical protein
MYAYTAARTCKRSRCSCTTFPTAGNESLGIGEWEVTVCALYAKMLWSRTTHNVRPPFFVRMASILRMSQKVVQPQPSRLYKARNAVSMETQRTVCKMTRRCAVTYAERTSHAQSALVLHGKPAPPVKKYGLLSVTKSCERCLGQRSQGIYCPPPPSRVRQSARTWPLPLYDELPTLDVFPTRDVAASALRSEDGLLDRASKW